MLSEQAIDAWWKGLTLWYNYGDYRQAMEVWNDMLMVVMVEAAAAAADDESSSSVNLQVEKSNTSLNQDKNNVIAYSIQQERKHLRNKFLRKRDDDSSFFSDLVTMAELMLFLAGCYLDASDPTTARQQFLIPCIALLEELLLLLLLLVVDDVGGVGGWNNHDEDEDDDEKQLQSELSLSALYTRAIRECICSVQEDTHNYNDQDSAALTSRQLLQYVLKQQQQQEHQQQQQQEITTTSSSSSPVRLQHVPWSDPRQNPGFFYPRLLRNQPTAIYKNAAQEELEWCRVLEDHWKEIQTELNQLLLLTKKKTPNRKSCGSSSWATTTGTKTKRNDTGTSTSTFSLHPTHWPTVGDGTHRDGAGEHDGSVVNAGGSWKEWVLFGSGAASAAAAANNNNNNSKNIAAAPRTCQLLQKHCPSTISLANAGGGEVIFSVLAPHTRIAMHCGTTNLRLTAHLGLIVPNDDDDNNNNNNDDNNNENTSKPKCGIQVADEWLTWQEGKMMVFDDSFEHQVVNDTDSIRAVLLIRFWHPALPVHEREVALQQALQAKQDDALRRCNPPLPPCHNNNNNNDSTRKAVWSRGMERTHCSSCWGTGFQTIRVDKSMRSFYCCCGKDIH